MQQFIEIHWTTSCLDEARRVCRYLVQERYAACAQISPWMESIFIWDQKVDTVQETKVSLKARREAFDQIKEIIAQNTVYEVPEILYRTLEGGNEAYLDWLEESLPLPSLTPKQKKP